MSWLEKRLGKVIFGDHSLTPILLAQNEIEQGRIVESQSQLDQYYVSVLKNMLSILIVAGDLKSDSPKYLAMTQLLEWLDGLVSRLNHDNGLT